MLKRLPGVPYVNYLPWRQLARFYFIDFVCCDVCYDITMFVRLPLQHYEKPLKSVVMILSAIMSLNLSTDPEMGHMARFAAYPQHHLYQQCIAT